MTAHGGRREGAGRPRGVATKAIRVPLARLSDINALLARPAAGFPLYASTVPAGFPSPADDFIEAHLDLNTHLVRHPAATFFVMASGDSMLGAGIHSGDMLIVDRSLEATHGRIVIAAIDGELTVKRLSRTDGRVRLLPENPDYPAIDISDSQDMVIWGVVTHVIHPAE